MADSKLPYFLCGLGVGAALGILYAPRSGEETREDLRIRANEGRDYVRRRAGEGGEFVRERAGEGREFVKQRAAEGRDYARERSSELKQRAGDVLDKGRGAVETQRGQLAAALEAGRKAYRDATEGDPAAPNETAEASEG
jgi:gas vesicle protein